MPKLSPDPSDETNNLLRLIVMKADNNTLASADLLPPFAADSNSIITNCLLYASLTFSLLAAVGAMMAKEWLQSFDRTGQTGPVEEQAIFRQRKFDGVQQWHLETLDQAGPVPETIPVTLVPQIVPQLDQAGPVPEITAGHTGSDNSRSEQAGARSPSTIQPDHFFLAESPTSYEYVNDRVFPKPKKLSKLGFLSIFRHKSTAAVPKTVSPEEIPMVRAVRWLLATTSNRGDQISSAQFICYLDKATCAYIFEDPDSWKCLKRLTLGAFRLWQYQPSQPHQVDAELFGLVLCRALLQYPAEHDRWNDIREEGSCETLVHVSSKYSPWASEDDLRILHIAMIFTALKEGSNFREYRWTAPASLLDGHTKAASALLGVWANLVLGLSCTTGSIEDLCDDQ
ncbi:hypothetical protein FRC01_010524 [Tulasnella sp. 417]|nr:hypothetical protein FRC01_010524 [Tulasnella sp. 417]